MAPSVPYARTVPSAVPFSAKAATISDTSCVATTSNDADDDVDARLTLVALDDVGVTDVRKSDVGTADDDTARELVDARWVVDQLSGFAVEPVIEPVVAVTTVVAGVAVDARPCVGVDTKACVSLPVLEALATKKVVASVMLVVLVVAVGAAVVAAQLVQSTI